MVSAFHCAIVVVAIVAELVVVYPMRHDVAVIPGAYARFSDELDVKRLELENHIQIETDRLEYQILYDLTHSSSYYRDNRVLPYQAYSKMGSILHKKLLLEIREFEAAYFRECIRTQLPPDYVPLDYLIFFLYFKIQRIDHMVLIAKRLQAAAE